MPSHFSSSYGRLALLLGLLIGGATAASAQAPGNGGNTGGPPPPPAAPTAVPLDGGASLLLASGVAYGVRRLRQYRRKPV